MSSFGKSTLLQIIGTLDSPTSGSVTLDDEDPFVFEEAQLAATSIGAVYHESIVEDLAIFFLQCIYLYEPVNELCVSDFAGQTTFTIFLSPKKIS